jgi:signal transduction histidine kinase
LILLDVNMPEMTGYEVCRQLKSREETREIPIIFISALNETLDKIRAFGAGGVDYVTKPFEFEEVMARVETHLELRRTQIELRHSYEKLRDLERLRDNLVHMVVHDMRSLLFSLLSTADFLQTDLAENINDQTREDLDSVTTAATRLNRMASDLLDVSKLEEEKMPVRSEECDLAEIVQEGVEIARKMDRRRPVRVDTSRAVRVVCDQDLVRRVVENLVTNGLKHTAADKPLGVSVTQEKGCARVSIRDEGSGIPQELQGKVFEKFGMVQARKEQKLHSVGLGLTFCKLAVEAQGGEIGVDSKVGEGSTFWFTLPEVQT